VIELLQKVRRKLEAASEVLEGVKGKEKKKEKKRKKKRGFVIRKRVKMRLQWFTSKVDARNEWSDV
jgi:hypothetical protein